MALSRLSATIVVRALAAASPTAAPVQPAPVVPDATRDDPLAAHVHGAHAHAHGHPAHSHPHPAAGHGPTPRPRRHTPRKSSKTRRKRGSAAPSDDDELEFTESHAGAGVAAVDFGGGHHDGGDDSEEGGDERSRQDRLGRARQLSEAVADAAGFQRLPPLHRGARTRLAVERFVQDSVDAVASGDPRMAARLLSLKLRLLRETPGVPRLDSGGLARVRQLLTTCMPRAMARHRDALSPQAAARRGNGLCMLVMHLLQLQVPMTPTQRAEEIARLCVLAGGHRDG